MGDPVTGVVACAAAIFCAPVVASVHTDQIALPSPVTARPA